MGSFGVRACAVTMKVSAITVFVTMSREQTEIFGISSNPAITAGTMSTFQDRAFCHSTRHDFPSTSNEDPDTHVTNKPLKKKRSALFYPSPALLATSNQAPYSRSAAKRDSIMALGSIGHLQHMYTKQGIASRNRPLHKGAVIAIGPAAESVYGTDASFSGSEPGNDTVSEVDEILQLPPSPEISAYKSLPSPNASRSIDDDELRSVMATNLRQLLSAWGWSGLLPDNQLPELTAMLGDMADEYSVPDVPDSTDLIEITTNAIRSTRNYFLALPTSSTWAERDGVRPKAKDTFKRQSSFCAASDRSSGFSLPMLNIKATSQTLRVHRNVPYLPLKQESVQLDHLGVLRKSALEVLSALREMDTNLRGSNEIRDGDLDDSSQSSIELPSSVEGKARFQSACLDAQRDVIRRYVTTVDQLLTQTKPARPRPEVRRAASALGFQDVASNQLSFRLSAAELSDNNTSCGLGSYHNGVSESLLTCTDDQPYICVLCLRTFLIDCLDTHPTDDLDSAVAAIVSSTNIYELLLILADGYVLCRVFNLSVARSKYAWGFIQEQQIQLCEPNTSVALLLSSNSDADVSVSSDISRGEHRGWTFRRAENLRVWAAALRLRYSIQSSSAAIHGSKVHPKNNVDVIEFDPSIVARKQQGWQEMLLQLITIWVNAVASESARTAYAENNAECPITPPH